MVYVIDSAYALAEIYEIAYRSEYVIENDMFGDKLIGFLLDVLLDFIGICRVFEDFTENLERNFFVDSVFFGIEINISLYVHHAVSDNLSHSFNHLDSGFASFVGEVFLSLNGYESGINASLFDFAGFFVGNGFTRVSHYLACKGIYNWLGKHMTCKAGGYAEFLVVFVSSETAQVISLCIKEKVVEVSYGTFDRRRLAGAEFLINVNECLGIVLGLVFLEDCLFKSFIRTEKLIYFLVGAYAERTDKSSKRNFPVLVYADIHNIGRIHFVFKPRAPVGYDSCLDKILSCLVLFGRIVNTGRTDKLRYYYTLCTVDDKGAAVGHEGEITHIDFAFADSTCFLVAKGSGSTHGNLIGSTS